MIRGMMHEIRTTMIIIPKASPSHMMGVDTPIPPVAMNAAAPDGAPPRRIRTVRDNYPLRLGSNRNAPPCLGEALRRGALDGPQRNDRFSPLQYGVLV